LPAIHASSRASRQACRQGYCDRQTIQWITHSLCSSPCFNVRFGSGPGIRFRSPVRHEDKKEQATPCVCRLLGRSRGVNSLAKKYRAMALAARTLRR
jgi:hypothetical protein